MPIRMHLAILLLLASCATAQSADPAIVTSEFINDNAPYASSHASTIAEVASGQLVSAWFGGSHEGHSDVGIWFARQVNGKWEPATEVATGLQPNGKRYPTWNPVLFQSPNGPLFLFYKVGPAPHDWWGMLMTSSDAGRIWSRPRRLPKRILGPIKNKPIVLPDGTWLAGSSTESPLSGWRVHFELSRDQGRTWQIVHPPHRKGFDAIQPTILLLPNGKMEALCRTRQGVIAMTSSSDGGRTWTALVATPLPNPNSGIDAVTLRDGRHLLVYNNSSGTNRYPLDVALSRDGIEWQHVLTLESEPRPEGYAYPAVIQTADGLVHITYTWDRRRIKHVVLDPQELESR